MKLWNFLLMVLVVVAPIFAGEPDKARLIGSWQLQDAAKDAGVWTFESKGEVLRVIHHATDQTSTQFACATSGSECDVKDAGKSGKVSMWFNGPKLVALETRGAEVVKRRFLVKDDRLELEIIPISPDGKTETLVLQRVKQ